MSSGRSFPFKGDDQTDETEKPMYRSMPAEFFGPDETDNPFPPHDTPRYRTLGQMQPAFATEFSHARTDRSLVMGYSHSQGHLHNVMYELLRRFNQDPRLHHFIPNVKAVFEQQLHNSSPEELIRRFEQDPTLHDFIPDLKALLEPQVPIWSSMGAFSDVPPGLGAPETDGETGDGAPETDGEAGDGAAETDGKLPPVWGRKQRAAACYSSGGAHANFVTSFGSYPAGYEKDELASLAMAAIQSALVKTVPNGVILQEGLRWKIDARVLMPLDEKTPPDRLFLGSGSNQRQGSYLADGTLELEMRLFRFASGQGSNSLAGSSGGLYGEPGLGPPVTVVTGGFRPTSNPKNEFILTILLRSGTERLFKNFVDDFRSVLSANENKRKRNDANECDEDGGGYLVFGHELYPGSLVMSPRRATNLALMVGMDDEAINMFAWACAQRTVPLGANTRLLASQALDTELRDQQMDPSTRKEGEPHMQEGLNMVYLWLTNGTEDVQWHALWIVLRLTIEAKCMQSEQEQRMQSDQETQLRKPSEHETEEDFLAFVMRVLQLLEMAKPTLERLVASTTSKTNVDRWSSPNLAQKSLDNYIELSS